MKRLNKRKLKKALKEGAVDGKDREFDLNGIPVNVKGGLVDYDEHMKQLEEEEKNKNKE